MVGFQTKYMSRNDFISDEAWNKFLRYRLCQQSKMAAAHNRSSRKTKNTKSADSDKRSRENRRI